MDENGHSDTYGVWPEEMMAQKLSEVGWIMHEQEQAQAELDPSFAQELRTRLVSGPRREPMERSSPRGQVVRVGIAGLLIAAGVLLDRLRQRHAAAGNISARRRGA
jgi:hypothetical protein